MPGNNPGMLVDADVLEADTVILDLEDAVSLMEKDSARILVRNALKYLVFKNTETCVRINPIDSPYWKDDLDEIVPQKPDLILIPKASEESIELIEKRVEKLEKKYDINKIKFLLLIESPEGIINLEKITRKSKRTVGLCLGAEDYTTVMGIKRTKESKEIEFARMSLVTMARAFGIDAIDTPFTDVDDFYGLRKDTEFIKSIGFTGKLLINPRHVVEIHDVLNPSKDEIERAMAIVEESEKAKEQGLGVFSFNGKMVDLPVINRARETIKTAKKWGLI